MEAAPIAVGKLPRPWASVPETKMAGTGPAICGVFAAGGGSVADVQRDRRVRRPDREGRLLEGRFCHDGTHAVRQRVALERQADEIGVEMVVVVLVVIGADRIGAGRQVVEHHRDRPGAGPDLLHHVDLSAVQKFARGRVEPDIDPAGGAPQPADRDDDARGKGRFGNDERGEGKSSKQDATMHTGFSPELTMRDLKTSGPQRSWRLRGSPPPAARPRRNISSSGQLFVQHAAKFWIKG